MAQGRGSTDAVAAECLEQRWSDAIHRFVGADPGRSVAAWGNGTSAGSGADVVRPGASVLKLFVSIAAHLGAADGWLDLDTTVTVDELPRSQFPSVLEALAPQHRFTLRELCGLALGTSDNRIAHHLVLLLGPARVNEAAHRIGCPDTSLCIGFDDDALGDDGLTNVTTAQDCAAALIAVQRDERLRDLRRPLRSSLFNSRILSGLPEGLIVSHKTGSLTGVVNDVGVVHAPTGDFIACFLCDRQTNAATTSAEIGRCTRDLFDAWQERQG